MAPLELKPGDIVWAKYRGYGTVVEPSSEDRAMAHFETDICVQFTSLNGKAVHDWLGPTALEYLESEIMIRAAHQVQPTDIDALTRDLWDGIISEARFTDCALEAGMALTEINAILEEIRAEDGGLS